jgi:hypothetical protein
MPAKLPPFAAASSWLLNAAWPSAATVASPQVMCRQRLCAADGLFAAKLVAAAVLAEPFAATIFTAMFFDGALRICVRVSIRCSGSFPRINV